MPESGKTVLIASHDACIGNSLRSALSTIAGMETPCFDITNKNRNKFLALHPRATLLLCPSSDDCLREWLWGSGIRETYKNPILVIGFAKEADFCLEHPIFDKTHGYPKKHRYLPIPFALADLKTELLGLKFLEDEDLMVIRKDFASDKKYILMILHDVQGTSKYPYNELCSRFRIARRYFEKNINADMIKKIDDYISKVPQQPCPRDWKSTAVDLADSIRNLLKNQEA